jgi:hypothetical protein
MLLLPSSLYQTLFAKLIDAVGVGDYFAGIGYAKVLCESGFNNRYILSEYAFCLLRVERYEEAYHMYREIFDAPRMEHDPAADYWLDGLTEVCGRLGRNDEVRRFGLEAMTRADDALCHSALFGFPSRFAPVFDASRPLQNIIAYSLFGDSPRYCETLVVNARLCRELFPEWTCRVYLDCSVPLHVTDRLCRAGAQIVHVENLGVQALPGVTWRFLVMDDPTVSRFMVRDADSLLSEREQAAVEQWLKSGYWFHQMRDCYTHTELLLAGLWGGCNGVIFGVRELISEFVSKQSRISRFVDQHFLKRCLWVTVRQSLLSHDEIFGFRNALNFPDHVPVRWTKEGFHVGSNATYQQIRIRSDLPDGALQNVMLHDTHDGSRLYSAPVKQHMCSLDLPFFLVDKFCRNELSVMPVCESE